MSAESLKKGIQIEWKEVEACSRRAEYLLSKELVDGEFAEALKGAAREVQLPGFRKGKAPLSLVKARIGEDLNGEVGRAIHQAAFSKTIEDKSVDILSLGDMKEEPPKPKQGEEYRFSFTFETSPEIKLPEYKGLKLEAPKGESVDEMLAKRITYLKELYADYKTLDEAAKAGDMVKVSYSSDFALPADAAPSLAHLVKADESWIWLSEPEQIPGAIKALEGIRKGESRSFDAVFPANHKEAALAGKTVKYTVNAVEIQRRLPIESDEQLASKLHYENIEKMQESLKKIVGDEILRNRKNALQDKAVETILTLVPDFPLPKGLFNSYTEREFRHLAESAVKSEADVEKFKQEKEKHLEESRNLATKSLKRFLVLRKIAELEKLSVEREEVAAQIKGMSAYYGQKESDIVKSLNNNGGIDELRMEMLISKAVSFLADKAQVSEPA